MHNQCKAPKSVVCALRRSLWTTREESAMSSGKNHFVRWRSLCLLLLITLLTACSTSSPMYSPPAAQKPTPALSPAITGPTAPGQKNCQPASPIDNSSVGSEVQGTATNAELWGLIMSTSGIPPLANTEVKIVWRMTGSGGFDIVASGPHGMKVPPSQGPTEHLGSNWNRPGDEWGTVFTFPVAGCWDLHATSDNAFGDVWLKIV
jgi:predicted small lipoprotein YifL